MSFNFSERQNNYTSGGWKPKPQGDWKPKQSTYDGNPKFYVPFTFIGTKNMPDDAVAKTVALIVKMIESNNDITLVCRTSVGSNGEIEVYKALKDRFPDNIELILPWKDFKVIEETFDSKNYFSSPESMDLAKKVYPTWEKQKEYMLKIYSKNIRMIAGQNIRSPSRFVLCWSPDGIETSAARTNNSDGIEFYLKVSEVYKLKAYNLAAENALGRLSEEQQLVLN